MSGDCKHLRVTTYSRMVFSGSREQPPEYAWRTTCDECGEEMDEVPEGSEERQREWEEDVPPSDYD